MGPQKHGARQSTGCVNPSFSEHRYPHASPPVTEPAQGAPRAIRGKPTSKICTHFELRRQPTKKQGLKNALGRAGPWNTGACPRAYGAKRVRVLVRDRRGLLVQCLARAPCFWGTYEWELQA